MFKLFGFTAINILIFICLGCADKVKFDLLDQTRSIDQQLRSRTITISNMFLYIPSRIILLDMDHLLIYDNVQKNFFNIVSLSNNELVNSWGEMGAGPGEFQMINDQSIQYHQGILSFLDINELHSYEFNTSYDSAQFLESEIIRPTSGPINGFVRVSDSVFWMDKLESFPSPFSTEFIEFSQVNPMINEFGHFPIELDKNSQIPRDQTSYFIKSSVTSPDQNKAAYYYTYHPLWKVINHARQELFYVDYSSITQEFAEGRIFYNVYAQAGTEFIFTLFLGTTKDVYFNKESNAFPELHIWTWNGQWVGRYSLDQKLSSITIDESASKLYGTDIEGGNLIYVYELPSTWKNTPGLK